MVSQNTKRLSWRHKACSYLMVGLMGALGSSAFATTAQAQALTIAPRVIHQALQPVMLSNGYVSIRDRLERARTPSSDLGVAPIEVQQRWRASLERKLDRLEGRLSRSDLHLVGGTADASSGTDAWDDAVARIVSARDPIREAQRLVHHAVLYRNDRPGRDHWQTPTETLLRGAGDCEDHAILKRELLIAAGFDPADVVLVFLRTRNNVGHVLVRVDTASGPRILDNRTTAQRVGRLLPGDQVLAEYNGASDVEYAGL